MDKVFKKVCLIKIGEDMKSDCFTPEQQKILDDNPGVNITFETHIPKLTPSQVEAIKPATKEWIINYLESYPALDGDPADIRFLLEAFMNHALEDLLEKRSPE
jgi:hypothetical protein